MSIKNIDLSHTLKPHVTLLYKLLGKKWFISPRRSCTSKNVKLAPENDFVSRLQLFSIQLHVSCIVCSSVQILIYYNFLIACLFSSVLAWGLFLFKIRLTFYRTWQVQIFGKLCSPRHVVLCISIIFNWLEIPPCLLLR